MMRKRNFIYYLPNEIGSSHFRGAPRVEPSDQPEPGFKLNPAPFLALFSLVFLLLGVAYNFGIFLPLAEKLVLNITLSDHIQTSIYVGLLVLLLPLILAILFVMLFQLSQFALILFTMITFVLVYVAPIKRDGSRYHSALTEAKLKTNKLSQTALALFKKTEAIVPQVLAIFFSALIALVINYALPESIAHKFKGAFTLMFFLLFVAASVLIWSTREKLDLNEGYRQPLRLAMSVVILLVFSFQVGVFDSLRTHRYLMGEVEAQYQINDKPAHIIRTLDKGLFVAVQAADLTEASIRFIPWKEVKSTDTTVLLEQNSTSQQDADTASEQEKQSEN